MEQTRLLIRQSQQGDSEARNQLVEENLALVRSVASRFLDRGLEFEDLVQIGSLGLLKAIRDFNFEFEVRFSTYAVPKIMGEIKQHLRHSSPLQVSRSLKKLASEAISAKDQLAQTLGRSPTISEIATHLEVEREEVVTALDAVAPVYSLQAPLQGTDDSPEFQDFIATTEDQEHFLLKQALEKLEPQEQQLILLRYFAERSQTEVAETLGISQAQISRMEARIIRQLRHEL
ncbi:MAG: SigB/SigF/SigG family RNA polymerase sigma factor [Firmicutes bacterium]|nr:SigB/SigF/SigG family RNA polymerase sigma factor [Bacillota bacterium]